VSAPETYPAPLDRLHALGLDEAEQPASVDYRAIGIGPDDVPALIRIATDARYDTAALPVAWAPLHAWRALGALRAAEAIEPLVSLLDEAPENDWILEDIPRALGLIGASAVPALARYIAEPNHSIWSRIAAGSALMEVGKAHPDVRGDCVAALTDQLRLFAKQASDFNAFLIGDLLDLQAVESAPVMEAAFAADRVDISINGDWEDVQVELGLLPERRTPKPRYTSLLVDPPRLDRTAPQPNAERERRAAEKRRRKMTKQSKRRNRRRK
jgi:hypothetical protein